MYKVTLKKENGDVFEWKAKKAVFHLLEDDNLLTITEIDNMLFSVIVKEKDVVEIVRG